MPEYEIAISFIEHIKKDSVGSLSKGWDTAINCIQDRRIDPRAAKAFNLSKNSGGVGFQAFNKAGAKTFVIWPSAQCSLPMAKCTLLRSMVG